MSQPVRFTADMTAPEPPRATAVDTLRQEVTHLTRIVETLTDRLTGVLIDTPNVKVEHAPVSDRSPLALAVRDLELETARLDRLIGRIDA
jgi:hypothetical protein